MDRKALGRQSFDDYKAFSNQDEVIQDTADTDVLVAKLKSDDMDDTLIVTSIQKMSNVTRDAENIKTADIDKIIAKRIVIIIDEAHRSTFGEMLTNIKETFIHAIIFGFTGTPLLRSLEVNFIVIRWETVSAMEMFLDLILIWRLHIPMRIFVNRLRL